MIISFTLTGRPHSKKNSRNIFVNKKTGKIVNIPNENFDRFKTDCLWQLKEVLTDPGSVSLFPISGPCEILTDFLIKGKMNLDADNAHTSILDILQDAGIIKNDNLVQKGHYSKALGSNDWFTKVIINIL